MPMAEISKTLGAGEGACELVVGVKYTVEPRRPAVVNADPSRCHPEEGGIELDGELELLSIATSLTPTRWEASKNFPPKTAMDAMPLLALLRLLETLIDEDELVAACEEDARERDEIAEATYQYERKGR